MGMISETHKRQMIPMARRTRQPRFVRPRIVMKLEPDVFPSVRSEGLCISSSASANSGLRFVPHRDGSGDNENLKEQK